METIYIGSYKTIKKHCVDIFQELNNINVSIYVNRFTSKLVYILYVSSVINPISFIKIGPVVFPQTNTLKS